MTIIAAITRDRALGRGGDMIYHISEDLRRFKSLTMGCPIIMGRKTFESFPKGPLPGRRNIVITRNADYTPVGAETQPSLEDALASALHPDAEGNLPRDIFVLGGGQVYAQAMDLADQLMITEIDAEAADADTFFPEIDSEAWTRVSESEWHEDARSQVRYRFVDFKKNA